MPADVICPSCAAPLTGGPAACPSCALPLTGPAAVRLWQIDQALAGLQSERQDVLRWLRASGPVLGPVATDQAGAAAGDLQPASTGGLHAPSASGWTGQQVLVSVGALLVLIAATVFVAVTWTALGVAGQVSVMAVVTVLAGVASVQLTRRGLRSTGAALAALTFGLAAVDAGAAYTLNLAGLQQVNDTTYVAFAAAVLALAFVLVSSIDLSIWPFAWGSVLAAVVVPASLLSVSDAGVAVIAGITLLAAAFFAAVRHLLPVRWQVYRLPLLVATGLCLAACWLLALPAVFEEPLRGEGGWCAAVALLASAGCAAVARVDRGFRVMDGNPVLVVVAIAAVLSAPVAVVGVAQHAMPTGLVVLAATAAAVSAAVLFAKRPLITHPLGFLAVAAQLAALGAVLDLAFAAGDDVAPPHPVALGVALFAVAVGAGVIAVRQLDLRVGAAAVAVACGIAAGGVVTYPHGTRWAAVALVVGAVVAAVLAGWRWTRPEEWALLGVAMLATLAALGFADDAGARPLAFVFAVSGLTALAYGVLPSRGYAAVLGVFGCSAATWTLFLDADVDVIEAYSLPLAGLAAVVGLVRWWRDRQAPSWLTVGPALTAGLLPSAVQSIFDEGFTRTLLVLLAGAIVLLGGVVLRWQSPVVVGALALALVSIAQLAMYAAGLPRWLSFGTVGLVLLVVGARYEQRRRNARRAANWVAALQ